MLDQILIGIGIVCILLVTVFRSQYKGKIGEFVTAKFLRELDESNIRL